MPPWTHNPRQTGSHLSQFAAPSSTSLLPPVFENSRCPQGADLDQLVPVATGAGQPRHLDAEHQADPPETDIGNQPPETGASVRRRSGPPLVIVDHADPLTLPAQRQGAVDQSILQAARFRMAFDLLRRRLPDVDDRHAVTMMGADLLAARGSHRVHRRPPSIPRVGDRRGGAGSGGQGVSSPCVAVRPADPTISPEPAKPSPSWRRSSHRATASKAIWPTRGAGLNRFGSSAVPAMDL